jgi:hypothetical protein
MNDQDPKGNEKGLHWSQTFKAGAITSIFGSIILGIITITSFTSGETVWGFIMLAVFLMALTAFTLRVRRQKRETKT